MYSHILRRHLLLILSECVHSAKRYIGVGDIVLTGRQEFQVITLLEDSTVIGGDIEARGVEDDEKMPCPQERATYNKATMYALSLPSPVTLDIVTSCVLRTLGYKELQGRSCCQLTIQVSHQ